MHVQPSPIAVVDAGFRAQAERHIARGEFAAALECANAIASATLCIQTRRQVKCAEQMNEVRRA